MIGTSDEGMGLVGPAKPRSQLISHRSAILIVLGIAALLVALVTWRYQTAKREDEDLSARRATERVKAIGSQLRDTISATLLQADAEHGIARLLTEARLSGDTAVEAKLRLLIDHGGSDVSQVSAIDANGKLIWTNIDWTRVGLDLSDRPHFLALRQNSELDHYFSRPIYGRVSDEWTVQYTRPVLRADGTLLAVTVVSLRASMLARLTQDMALAPDDVVGLVRDDGAILMRRDMGNLGKAADFLPNQIPAPAPQGRIEVQRSPLDGVPRYRSMWRLPGTDLMLLVGLSKPSQMQALDQARERLWSGTLLLDGIIVTLAALGIVALGLMRRVDAAAMHAASVVEREAWLRTVIDDMAQGVVVLDGVEQNDLRVSYANREICKTLDVLAERVIGQDVRKFIVPEDHELLGKRTTRMAARDDKLGRAIYRMVRSDGRRIWVEMSSVVVLNPLDPARLRVITTIRDISVEREAAEARRRWEQELKRLNRALAAYSRSLAALIRSASLEEMASRVCEGIVEDPVYALACVGVPEPSPGFPIRVLARAGTEPHYLDQFGLTWSRDADDRIGIVDWVLRKGRPFLVPDILSASAPPAQRERWQPHGFRSSLCLPCKVDSEAVGVLIIYATEPEVFGPDEIKLFEQLSDEMGFAIKLDRDRGRLRDAELARAAAETNLSDAVRLGPGVLYRARVGSAEYETLQVFGKSTHTIQIAGLPGGLGVATLRSVLDTAERRTAIRALGEDGSLSEDILLAASDGSPCWLRNAVRVSGRSNDAVDVVGYIADVTKEKAQELHGQHVTTLLTLGEMATGMAHELNQPLASISFAAQNADLMLSREPVDTDAIGGKLAKIVAETSRAFSLIEHMRLFARNDPRAIGPVDWHDVLRAAQEILRHKLNGCEIVDDMPHDLPPVAGSMIPLEQVLINLIGNAIDAYDSAAPDTPRCVRLTGDVLDNMVVLRVSDRAGGIPPDVISRIFEPFFTTKTPGKGTGLGLGLAFGTITELGGTITAANEDGGAVFEIRLPIAAAPALA